MDDNKEAKVNKKMKNFRNYFKDMKNELKKVVWPDRAQLINNTVTVLVFTLLTGMLIWVADGLFSKLASWIYR
ncbi:MAG: preprotein translocase subunit SecE [Clostridiales bacterium]|nr:preprotein translocase subunit SecE [Clostridiales bacterium]